MSGTVEQQAFRGADCSNRARGVDGGCRLLWNGAIENLPVLVTDAAAFAAPVELVI